MRRTTSWPRWLPPIPTRNWRSGLILLAACAALASCSGDPPASTPTAPAATAAEEPLLNVYNWAEYMAPEALSAFERETGIKVVYDTFDGNESLADQLGQGRYDLVFPSARPWAARFIADNRLRKLDKGTIDGLGRIDAELIHGLSEIDPGNQYLVPYLWGTTGLAIDVAAVRARLGEDASLDHWSILLDPAQVSKLVDCGVTIVEDMTDVMSSALIANGRSTLHAGDDDLAEVERTLMAIRPFVRIRNAQDFDDGIADGTSCLVLGYSGDLARARAEAETAGRNVVFVIPIEGAVRWVDVMAIPADAPHPGNAHRLINHLLKPDVIASISNTLRYANANVEATPMLDESLRADTAVFPDRMVGARLKDAPVLPDERRADWRAIWKRFLAEPGAEPGPAPEPADVTPSPTTTGS